MLRCGPVGGVSRCSAQSSSLPVVIEKAARTSSSWPRRVADNLKSAMVGPGRGCWLEVVVGLAIEGRRK